jgi:pimeloyl-ACP methyl ester carboxylesterase
VGLDVTPVVLLPGMMCDARLFGPQTADLSRDRPVQLAPIGAADTVEALAEAVLADVPERFALVGLSMGGIVAMEVVRRAPERVERLGLLDTNHRSEAAHVSERRERQIEAVRAGRLREVLREEMKPHYLAPGPGRQPVLDLVMEMAMALGPDVFERQSRALAARPDQTETLRRVACPTLVLCGRHDALCPLERHEEMARLVPGARMEIVEGAGHLPTLERPAETGALLRRFLG